MGTTWDWKLHCARPTTVEAVQHLLERAARAGLSPERPGGEISAFDAEGGHRVVERNELVAGLAARRHATNLWTQDKAGDVWLSTGFGRERDGFDVHLSLGVVPRPPAPEADEFRAVHRALTGLWLELADDLDADVGRVDHEWSLDQVWRLIPEPVTFDPPPPAEWPFPLGWWTFVGSQRYPQLPALPSWLPASIERTPGGGAVVALTDDPAMIDVLDYEDIHIRLLADSR